MTRDPPHASAGDRAYRAHELTNPR